jgi:hypothetical protein
LSPFSVYIALSRSRGRKTICILRDFDPALLMHHPSEELRKDMMRLELLDQHTKEISRRKGLQTLRRIDIVTPCKYNKD